MGLPASPPLVLASASPRRHELLAEAGVAFTIEVSDVEEVLEPGLSPEEAASSLALQKAVAVADRHRAHDVLVIGADTVVAVDTPEGPMLLGKPADAVEAKGMLELLSGSRHRVVTGVAVLRTGDDRRLVEFERTWVRMREITPEEVGGYVASGEWRDKAGGYAIQENADAFVTGLEEGGFDNVVGLPVKRTLELVARLSADDPAP